MEKPLVIFALLISFSLPAQTLLKIGSYRFTATKAIGLGALAAGALADGMVEGYTFDGRKSFERKYDVDPRGYWGSESWRRAYKGGEPANGFKSPAHRIAGSFDFYHHADDARKLGYITGGITLGICGARTNTKWWHYVLDFGIGFGVSAAAKSAGMHWVRS